MGELRASARQFNQLTGCHVSAVEELYIFEDHVSFHTLKVRKRLNKLNYVRYECGQRHQNRRL